MSFLERCCPEVAAGGFTRADGTLALHLRVAALLSPEMTVLDFGAGRGMGAVDVPVPFRRSLRVLKRKYRKAIGADTDPAVGDNPARVSMYFDMGCTATAMTGWPSEHPELQLAARQKKALR